MVKCVLTGWNGFIAQNLEKTLKGSEFSVLGMPRDILYDFRKITEFFNYNKPDFIIHTAAYGNKYSQDNDFETIYANIIGLANLLEMTRNIDYQGFINFSSSSVMLSHETFYSATKASGERIVRAFVNKYNKPVFSVRPFTVIGKGEQEEHLIPRLIKSCQLGIEIPFVSNPVHDFIGVKDLCEAVLCLMQYADKLKGQIIDIGSGECISNKKIKEIVEKITHKKANIKEVESLRPYDTKKWVSNIEVLSFLGWKPKQTIEDIILEMIG
jgi:nucleoside-diphosphate-sugar epimerase